MNDCRTNMATSIIGKSDKEYNIKKNEWDQEKRSKEAGRKY